MSILEGNGRWTTKFMSPEHKAQYLEQKNEEMQGKPQALSQQIMITVRDSVLLPMMMNVIEKNRKEIERSNYSLKGLYTASADALLDLVHDDLVKVKKELRELHIKVIEDDRIDDAIHYRFIYKGYEHKFALMRFVVRSEISVRLGRYIAALFQKQKPS
ncbi:hypothetical protein [Paenibacillus montanisoli]|uniref:Uncharacterized protein n=1 Tax=Paenibacillus montanisoli TaxID=2081970 RepID=A0A328U6F8_9BACL|nr:hypothetical protein [Paenibacillus montanisoli]RAP76991.1 hypothetical protein DL346_00335 [Paenibacillus montanisoli]